MATSVPASARFPKRTGRIPQSRRFVERPTSTTEPMAVEPLSVSEKSPDEQFKDQLKSQYGDRVGFEIYQLVKLQEQLEEVKDVPGKQKKEKELIRAIASARRSIRSAQISQSTGGGKQLKGPGINTVITRASGQKEIFESSPEGQKVTVIKEVKVPVQTSSPQDLKFQQAFKEAEAKAQTKLGPVAQAFVAQQLTPKPVPTKFETFFSERRERAEREIQESRRHGNIAREFIFSGAKGLINSGEFVAAGLGNVLGEPGAQKKATEIREETKKSLDAIPKGIEILKKSKDPAAVVLAAGAVATKPFVDQPSLIAEVVTTGQVSEVAIRPITTPLGRFVKTKATRVQEKIDPGVFREKSVEILPTSTRTTELPDLLPETGTKTEVSHVTIASKLKVDPVSIVIKKVKGESTRSVRLTGPPTKALGEYRQFIEQKQFFEFPTEKPGTIQGLGGFAGFFDEAGSPSTVKKSFSILPQEPIILVRNATVFPTPTGSLKGIPKGPVTVPGGRFPITRKLTINEQKAIALLREQEKATTKTFLAAENLAKISTERQVTSPVLVESFPITKRPPSRGAILLFERSGKVFARRKVPLPELVTRVAGKDNPLLKRIQESDFFTETQRFGVFKTRKVPIRSKDAFPQSEKIPSLDVSSFDQGQSISNVKSVSLSSVSIRRPLSGVRPPTRSQSSPQSQVSVPSFPTSSKVSSITPKSSPVKSFVSKQISTPKSPGSIGGGSFPKLPVSPPRSPPSLPTSFTSGGSPPRSPPSPPVIPIKSSPPISPPKLPPSPAQLIRQRFRPREFRRKQDFSPAFGVVTKKFGKPVLVKGKFTKEESLAAGTRVTKSLRASFTIIRVPGVAKRQGITPLATKPFKFNPKTKFFVEPKETRLQTRQERSEIQLFRRLKIK